MALVHDVAPGSWLVQRDVDEGRATLNFSDWDRPQPEVEELVEVVADGGMPPANYALIHPDGPAVRCRAGHTARRRCARCCVTSPPIAGGDDEPEGEG